MHCSCSFIIDHSISALQLQFHVLYSWQDLSISALQLHFYVLTTVCPIYYLQQSFDTVDFCSYIFKTVKIKTT